jgi:2-dehydro-3-deoxyphosphooctonate aldolase (KDO 8-P synthase)
MPARPVKIAPGYAVGTGEPPIFFAGPCVIESRKHSLAMAKKISAIAKQTGARIVFKSSFDKANRSSADSFRGPGLSEGLDILAEVKEKTGLPVITDVHEPGQAQVVAAVVDVLQVPAFLCRQTDLLIACAETGKPINIKKGQFVAPPDMRLAVEKCRSAGNTKVMLCERGTTFGYNNLVVDFRSFPMMAEIGVPVIYDATHSLQLPGGGRQTGGLKQYAPVLARAAAATGFVDGYFLEIHDDPEHARSDASTQLDIKILPKLIRAVLRISKLARGR